ncbi:MAG: hypothetical protein JWQ38_1882 [Flavipsychrobacter sp.]|nr:hypothetical protein [Flavipsychrobacter sp.]
MKKVFLLLFALIISFGNFCFATDHNTDELLSWMKLSPKAATKDGVTSLLGKPASIEENKKRTWWHYVKGNTDLTISWNNKSETVERFSFTCTPVEKTAFDARISRRLKSGTTDIMQAVKILGVPHDMTIKAVTQEMHYAYSNSVLRLFFRNGTLVDYTLMGRM